MSASAPSSPSLMDRSIHISLREEVQFLRRKVVKLETAEVDNERLRKELARIQMKMQEHRSQIELEFMNQMSTVVMENATQLEEIECRLKESNNVNRMLSDQLAELGGREGVQRRIDEAEKIHQREIASIVDRQHEEMEKIEEELRAVRKSRDDVSSRLLETTRQLEIEKRKVLEDNIGKRNSAVASPSPLEESLQAMLETVQEENKRLQQEVNSIEQKIEEKYREDVRAIREKLRSRDSELNMKTGELRRLESEVKASKSRSTAFANLEKENQELKDELDNTNKLRREREATITQLENELRETKHLLRKGENEIKELKAAVQRQNDADVIFSPPQRHSLGGALGGSINPTGKRTSEIIMKLEQNLKREGQKKQNAVLALKSRSGTNQGDDRNDGNEVASLKSEVEQLNHQLEKERRVTMSLRKEFQELKSATNTTADVQDKIHKQQRAGANNVGETLPPVRSEKSDTCDAVKGIVKHIEKKIWRHQSTLGTTESATIQRLMDHATRFPGLAEDLEEVRDELNLERLQVVELEDELTRQCEINCALLKEISTLATENESSRNSRAQSFGVVNAEICDNQKKEIDRLMIEVANFKSKLLNVEKSKSKLENDLAMMEKENAELQTVRKQLKLAESDARRIASQMENTSLLSSAEISSLQRQVDELEDKLSTAEHKIKELEQAEASNPSTDGLEKMKEEFDQLRRLDQDTINFFKTKVSELEAEIANARDEAKSSQIVESLEAQVAVLQASLRKGDVARAELESERENLVAEVERLNNNRKEPDDTSEEQQLRLEELQQLVDQKVEQFEKLRAGDQQQISSLRNEVVSLERQLSSARQQLEALSLQLQKRDEVEDQVDVLARKNVESLHAQINKLQNEMMKKQVELSESEVESAKEISALEDTIERMNAEMDQTIASKSKEIDELRRTIDTKEQKIRQIETEKEQLLLSMNEMMKNRRDEIDELQSEFMEMSSKAANQAREVQTLKLLLAESEYRKDEMDRLRARVTELSDQVSSRGDNKRSQSTSSINGDRTLTDLEVENSSLRQKLRKAVSEKQSAEEKLRDYVENKEGTSRTVQVLRERNTALKFEVEKLTRKLQKAQGLRRMSSSTDSSRNSRSTSDRSQNKLHQRTLGTVSSQSSEESSKIESIRFVI